jgi:hypothetical protein
MRFCGRSNLTNFPFYTLALGPTVEHLQMLGGALY